MEYSDYKREHPFKIFVYTLALIASLVYIVYRLFFTMPFGLGFFDVVFGLVVIFIEMIEALEFFAYYRNTLCVKKVSPETPKVKDYPEVDVFIATINEDEALLEKTIKACTEMKYPEKVTIYLCDDGNRKEIKMLARRLKIQYVTRENNKGAKAGNYNHALSVSKSPYVAIFDADMQPSKNFLLKTVPFFVKYDNIGFVQTPQSFNNPDIFQARLAKNIPFEQDYFYHYLQLARNNVNSVILCGTNCVISRKVLKSIGGFAEDTIAEDVTTGMLIEAIGKRGIAIDEVLAHGEAVDDVSGFLKQRSRWGRGCIQTIKSYGVFRNYGLTFRQKLDYFAAIHYWQFGTKRIMFLVLPLLFVFFNVITVHGNLATFLTIFLIQYILKRFIIDFMENCHKSSTWTKIYEFIQAPFMAGAVLKETFGMSNKKFDVTPKGKKSKKTATDYKLLFRHIILLVLTLVGTGFSIYKLNTISSEIYIVPTVWLAINSIYLLVAIIFDLRNNKSYKKFTPNEVSKYHLKSYFELIKRSS